MDSPKLISTAQIPPQFLKAAFLAGHVPYKALGSDPRVSYKLYIPPEHLNGDPYNQKQKLPILPLIVVIHGTRRTSETFDALVPWSHTHPCAILTPLFPTGLDGLNDLDSYKILSSKTLRADLALLSMLEEVSQRWPGIETSRFFLVGFSGGGQFAHRFFYLHPERLCAVSIGAPGRTTKLDESMNWPRGIKDVHEKFGRSVDIAKLREVKAIQLVVGEEDNVAHGGEEFSKWLDEMRRKKSGKIEDDGTDKMAPMKAGRLQLARYMLEEWKENGIEVKFDVVPGVAHSSQGVIYVVLDFLEPLI